MKQALLALYATLVLAPLAAAQDPPDEQVPDSPIVVSDNRDEFLRIYKQVHGGEEVLDELETLRFEFQRTQFDAETGEESEPGAPLLIEAMVGGASPLVRIAFTAPGAGADGGDVEVVQISDGQDDDRTRLWIDGEEKTGPTWAEEKRQALLSARDFRSVLDLLYRPDSPQLKMKVEGQKTRDETSYLSIHYEFHPDRNLFEVFRLFYNDQTGLVDRYETFSVANYKKLYRVDVSDYVDTELGVKVPQRFVFRLPRGEALQAWTFSNVVANPELPDDHFDPR